MAFKFTKENIESLSSKIERQIEWRRGKVVELDAQGHSQPEIASILHVSVGTVNGDLAYVREQAKSNIKRYIDERLPQEYEKCLIGLNLIHKTAWNIAVDTYKDCITLTLRRNFISENYYNLDRIVSIHALGIKTTKTKPSTPLCQP